MTICQRYCLNYRSHVLHCFWATLYISETIGVRPMGLRGGCSPPRIVQIAIFEQKSGNIRAKPLDFRASNGRKYSGKRLQPP